MKEHVNISSLPQAWSIRVEGNVQGVGFRPFVYRLASELGITGHVKNTPNGAMILAEGFYPTLQTFVDRLTASPPPIMVHAVCSQPATFSGMETFEINTSQALGSATAWIMPDMAPCLQCLAEMNDPGNRRYRYPFINCTHCGPRYSIIEALPYDRPNTSMKTFNMCPRCRAEYDDPQDRRFHAQPNACPECGPHMELWDPVGKVLSPDQDAIVYAAKAIQSGQIIALKGIGGFQLLADAHNDKAIRQLRQRKQRAAKPLALMFPDIYSLENYCRINRWEKNALTSRQAPIVLAPRRKGTGIAGNVAPGNPYLGVMLPSSPLHHLLMQQLDRPVVATSGNLSEEPICIDNAKALQRLGGIADLFLVHDRPIVRHVDDSVVKTMAGGITVLRRARGYAPLPIVQIHDVPDMLALGGHLKNTVSLSRGGNIFTGQHIGDLESEPAYQAFANNIRDLQQMYPGHNVLTIHDKHPDYVSTQYAIKSNNAVCAVQHHVAHIYSCMAEHELQPPVLGFAWDGTGYGDDGTIWGGEAISIHASGYERIGHLLPFALPGGDQAVKHPWRSLTGLLYTLYEGKHQSIQTHLRHIPIDNNEYNVLLNMLDKGVNSPVTSSAGRLFDAVASLLGIRHNNQYEGQAAMQLEFCAMRAGPVRRHYPYRIQHEKHHYILDWRPMLKAILSEKFSGADTQVIAARFHHTLSGMITKTATLAQVQQIVLTGGVFQNRLLCELTVKSLRRNGLQVYIHRQAPPNDGGISTGQILAGWQHLNKQGS